MKVVMIAEHKRTGNWMVGLAFAVSLGSLAIVETGLLTMRGVGVLFSLLFITGCTFYARAKGRHWAWGLLGFSWLIGLIVLLLLEDRAPKGRMASSAGGSSSPG